jgi:uncharacterized membrane protein YedE/YeeE
MKRFIDSLFILALLFGLGVVLLELCALPLLAFAGISVEPWRVAYLVAALAGMAACLTVVARR